MTEFQPMREKTPPPSANGQASLAYDPEDRQLRQFVPGEGVEVWDWQGDGWSQNQTDLLPSHRGRPLACWGLGATHIFGTKPGELVISTLEHPDRPRSFDAPKVAVYPSHGFVGYDATQQMFIICLPDGDGSQTYVYDGDQVEHVATGPYLVSGCWDTERNRVIGIDVSNTTYRLHMGRWKSHRSQRRAEGSDLAYVPWLGKVVRLIAESDDLMRLWGLGDEWEPLFPTMRPYVASAALGVDPARREIVSVGGQDFRQAAGSPTSETWVSRESSDFETTGDAEADAPLHGGGFTYLTPDRMGEHLVVVDHNTRRVSRQTGSGWETIVESGCGGLGGSHATLDYRYVNFAASDEAIYMHDAQGGLWRVEPGGRWEELAAPQEGPDPCYSRRVAMAWDRAGDRLVLFGSHDQNDTWVFEDGAWREFDDEIRPTRGIASMAATDRGTYLLAGRDLWRLADHRWECVGSDPERRPRGLVWDPKRDRLLSFGSDWEGAEILTWEAGGWRQVATGPDEMQICETMSGMSAEAGVDPAGDRLLLLHTDMDWELDLGSLDLGAAEPPTSPVEPSDATEPAPKDALTTAVAIEPTDEPAVAVEDLSVDVMVPEGWRLVALIPNRPEGPLPEPYTGVAVLYAEDPWANDFEPWRLDGGGIEVRPLQGEPPPLLVHDGGAAAGMMTPARFEPFPELAPEMKEQYNSPGGGADEMAGGTKIGGYPTYIQGEPMELLDRPSLTYLGQLCAEVFGALFGDAGAAYLYIGDDGETAAVVQSH